jgi:hypothetical protein
VSTFEAEHPGYNSTNYVDAFRTEDGELQETEEFFKVDGWYTLLDMAR